MYRLIVIELVNRRRKYWLYKYMTERFKNEGVNGPFFGTAAASSAGKKDSQKVNIMN